jgi:hypothetical protein
MKPNSILIAAALGCSLFTILAQAGSITTATLLTETMMETESFNELILYSVLGADTSSTLHYSSFTDPSTNSFSYMTLPGQTYDGVSVSLSGSGEFDQNTGVYSYNTAGLIGSDVWSGSGTLQWVGDPTATPCFNVTLGGKVYRVCATLEVDGTGDSTGTYTFTGPDGKVYGPYNGSDHLTTGGWFHSITVPKNPVTPDGSVNVIASIGNIPGLHPVGGGGFDGGGVGSFQSGASPVPEPSSAVMLGLGGVFLMTSRLLARRLKGN